MGNFSGHARRRAADGRVAAAVAALIALQSFPLRADEIIGGAVVIENQVVGAWSGRSAPVTVGDDVYSDEVISTAEASRAHLKLRDRTEFEIGARSQVKLDKYVYDRGAGAASVVVNATKGVFRFVSAPSGHAPYEVRTPVATIGVRGTSFGVRSLFNHTDVVLYDGVVEVCRVSDRRCETMDKPCTIVSVTGRTLSLPREIRPEDWDYDGTCLAGQWTKDAKKGPSSTPGDPGQDADFPTIGVGVGVLAVGGGAAAAAVALSHKSASKTIFAPISP